MTLVVTFEKVTGRTILGIQSAVMGAVTNLGNLNDHLDAMNGFTGEHLNKCPLLWANALLVSSATSSDSNAPEEIFSNICVRYLNQILNEEEMDGRLEMFEGHPGLEATEKPFYDILGEKYPHSPDQPPLYDTVSPESPEGSLNVNSSIGSFSSGPGAFDFSSCQDYPVTSGYSLNTISEELEEAQLSKVGARDLPVELPESFFLRGIEEGRKFLPSEDKWVIDLEADGFPQRESIEDNGPFEVKVETQERENSVFRSRGQKNRHSGDLGLEEGRRNKQSAVDYSEETLRSDMLDLVLLDQHCKSNESDSSQGSSQNASSKYPHSGQTKGSGGGRGRRKMQSKNEAVDLTTLLLHCAQAVSTDDRRTANDLLKQIRQHASPYGDGTQRLAICFADGLEARMAGTGSQTYCSMVGKPVTATDIVKAYALYMGACPFKRISYFFSSQMILKTIEKASAVHIIDFGIYFGFQWPAFFECLSKRHGGPPKIKITGIEIPQPGFRPAERIEQTGRRLAEYARRFNVPFEYHPIAAQWENIRIEDLKINEEEMLIVNCLFRLKNLADESVEVDCPRDKVLNMIKKLKPAIFVHGIVNGSYNAPFFVTRFRQALFHFSALSDMLETTTDREDPNRLVLEKGMFGRDALNVIACEGSARVERPETYKQWQIRNLRAGFVQLPLDRDIVKKASNKVKCCYHKDFVIDEDGRWLVHGWKGRILYALSAWRSNNV